MNSDPLLATVPSPRPSQSPVPSLEDIDTETFVGIRRQIHAEPELGFEVGATSRLVASLLESWGYEVHTGIGRSGVVGQLRRGQGSRRLGIRADMDALPIAERTGLSYASRQIGRMHACGHDGHTAMLLGAAKILAAEREQLRGEVRFIFQHAEELPPGGAQQGAVAAAAGRGGRRGGGDGLLPGAGRGGPLGRPGRLQYQFFLVIQANRL